MIGPEDDAMIGYDDLDSMTEGQLADYMLENGMFDDFEEDYDDDCDDE